MKLRTFAALFLASGMILAASPASAQAVDTSNVMGLRFEATLFNPFDVRGIAISGGDDLPNPAPARIDTFRPQGDIRIGYDLPMGLTPMIGFGLRTQSVEAFARNDDSLGSQGRTDLVLAAELRYYFGEHKRGLQPFVFGEFNTTIVSFGTEAAKGQQVSDGRKEFDKLLGDVNSVTNLNAGLGMEYKFAKSFAIGAKWGLGLSFAPSDDRTVTIEDEFGDVTLQVPSTSNTVFGTSSSIYAAFRL